MITALTHDGLDFEGDLVEHPLGLAGQEGGKQANRLLVLRARPSGARIGFRVVRRTRDHGARIPIHQDADALQSWELLDKGDHLLTIDAESLVELVQLNGCRILSDIHSEPPYYGIVAQQSGHACETGIRLV